jgi:hypothetical protein
MWLGRARSGVTLRLAKDATTGKKGDVAPSFNQCVIDPEQGSIRLLPPTGLLSFLSGQQARTISAGDVRNVELRHTVTRRSMPKQQEHGVITEITHITYTWDVYLTLPDESVLLAQTSHTTTSDLSRRRATSTGEYSAVDLEAGIEYLRQHQMDQQAYDTALGWAESAALVIAGTLGVRLVKTEVEQG